MYEIWTLAGSSSLQALGRNPNLNLCPLSYNFVQPVGLNWTWASHHSSPSSPHLPRIQQPPWAQDPSPTVWILLNSWHQWKSYFQTESVLRLLKLRKSFVDTLLPTTVDFFFFSGLYIPCGKTLWLSTCLLWGIRGLGGDRKQQLRVTFLWLEFH